MLRLVACAARRGAELYIIYKAYGAPWVLGAARLLHALARPSVCRPLPLALLARLGASLLALLLRPARRLLRDCAPTTHRLRGLGALRAARPTTNRGVAFVCMP
jgi:hypothetical protein